MAGFLDFMMPAAQNAPQAQIEPMQAAPQGYAAMQAPVPPEVQQMNQPAQSPEDLSTRVQGWMEVVKRVTSDPNLMRAVGYFGNAAMQPRAPGQSTMGHLGQAMMVGRSAYDFGNEAEFNRQLAMRKEGREQSESEAMVGLRKAQTSGAEANTAGQVTANEVAAATKGDTIARAKVDLDSSKALLRDRSLKADSAQIELDKLKRHENIIKSLPPSAEKDAVLAELKRPQAELGRIAAQTAQAGAAASASSAHAKVYNAQAATAAREEEDIKTLPTVQERLNARTKARGGSVSAQVQMLDAFKSNYKIANPGATDQAVASAADKYLTVAKGKPDMREFLDYAAVYGTNDEKKDYERFQAARAGTPIGKVPGPGSGRGTTVASGSLPSPKTQEEYNALPAGSQYLGSDGKVRTKK